MKFSAQSVHILIALLLTAGWNCSAPRQSITISMSPDLEQMDKTVSAAWFSYGMNRALWQTKTFFERNPGVTTYSYTIEEEVECRKLLANIWVEMSVKSGSHDEYLDDLAKVAKAGYITEYVWKYLRSPDWTIPSELREDTFETWVQNNIVNHKCRTLSSVFSKEKLNQQNSQYTQQELLNKAIVEIGKNRFDKAEAILNGIMADIPVQWRAFYESKDSIYCAFWDEDEKKRCKAQYPDRTIVSLFPSFSRVQYLLGFIKVEMGDAEGALAELNKAAALQPDHTIILLEQGTIFSYLKRHKDAYDCFVLADKPYFTSSSSTTARALRGQGVTLIDLGRLDEAEVCFDKSLKYDPDNKITLNELEYIRRLRSGQSSPGADIEIKNKLKK